MPNLVEFAINTAEVGLRTFPLKDEISIIRYTCAPIAGIYSFFPDEIRKRGLDNSLRDVSHLTPFLVALNEAADIGVSAELLISLGVRQERLLPLLQLKNGLFRSLKEEERACIGYFGSSYTQQIEAIENDFLLLSLNRADSNPRPFLELDSGIIEAAYLAITVPESFSKTGIKLEVPCRSVGELYQKYKIFLTEGLLENGQLGKLDDTCRKILALHAVAMGMKIDDDKEGKSFDKLMRLPSFSALTEKDLKSLEREYALIAQECGYPLLVQKLTRLFSQISGSLKDERSRRKHSPSDDPYNIYRFYGMSNHLFLTLRHQMEASGIIDRLFNDWPGR